MKLSSLLAACVLGSTLFLTAQNDEASVRVLAVVADKVFTSVDVRASIKKELDKLQRELPAKEYKQYSAKLMKNALDAMINKELIYLDFKDLKATIPTAIIQERFDAAVSDIAGGDIILFEEKLYKDGMSITEYKERIHKEIAVEMLLRNKIRNGVSISDSAIETYYQEHRFDMVKPSRYHIAIILIRGNGRHADNAPEIIATIQSALKNGTPFEDLAKKYSEDPHAQEGGDQGWMASLNETILNAVNALPKNGVTPVPVKIGSNAYFIKVHDIEAGGVPPLNSELQEQIKDTLVKLEEKNRLEAYLNELHMKYPVRRMD